MIVKPNSQTHNNELFHRKFEAQVAINPHSIAVAYKGVTMSYQELNNSANQLARVIVKEIENKGCERNSPICLFLHKNIQAIVAIVAVLKSGAAYVPISIDYPEARVAYFLNHTASPIVLSEKVNEERLSKSLQAVTSNISTVFVDEIDAKISKKNLDYIHAPEDLAYILYTSGTTGRPKGVMLRYDTFSSFIETFNE